MEAQGGEKFDSRSNLVLQITTEVRKNVGVVDHTFKSCMDNVMYTAFFHLRSIGYMSFLNLEDRK